MADAEGFAGVYDSTYAYDPQIKAEDEDVENIASTVEIDPRLEATLKFEDTEDDPFRRRDAAERFREHLKQQAQHERSRLHQPQPSPTGKGKGKEKERVPKGPLERLKVTVDRTERSVYDSGSESDAVGSRSRRGGNKYGPGPQNGWGNWEAQGGELFKDEDLKKMRERHSGVAVKLTTGGRIVREGYWSWKDLEDDIKTLSSISSWTRPGGDTTPRPNLCFSYPHVFPLFEDLIQEKPELEKVKENFPLQTSIPGTAPLSRPVSHDALVAARCLYEDASVSVDHLRCWERAKPPFYEYLCELGKVHRGRLLFIKYGLPQLIFAIHIRSCHLSMKKEKQTETGGQVANGWENGGWAGGGGWGGSWGQGQSDGEFNLYWEEQVIEQAREFKKKWMGLKVIADRLEAGGIDKLATE